ncbi:NAD(P)-binding protein [Cucurbitaria berberidis CBS 394.84]|uniref:NAD(P)-binding protein n=1 Tax=Cucurbitaria berberidis CBS 394.84 TaxID=1168544 RepID=A0A9P4L5H5_9PLEO|nr:NAD(P)-binding protein [Cucurbitaria berberidis CBS 394.84]KAF1842347.1 NAD(P)-binding protein [Cucurbitaria berberidis CBS 394.84]
MPSSPRVAIVTGGNSGMGMGLVRKLVEENWKVAIADINENEEFAEELGQGSSFHKCNVADYDSQADMFQQVWDKYGRIDALCANAGIVDKSSIFIFEHRNSDKIPPKPDLLCTDVDFKGVVYGTQLAIHFMRKNTVPGGKIIATASVAAVVPHESYPEYAGAKAAVVNFVRATARILKNKENITINAICPGIVHTSIIPQEMVDAVSPECLTSVSTIVSAYEKFLEDESLYGRVLECSADKHFFLEPPTLANGRVSRRAVTVWDPLFKIYHKESSGLPDAIP